MGTFLGHALPGTFFIIFSLWWTVNILVDFFKCFGQRKPFRSSTTYHLPSCFGKLSKMPVEPCVKIFFTSFGIVMEIITGFHDNSFSYYGNAQHATMFFFYGLTGVADLLLLYDHNLPADLDYATYFIAIVVEAVLFTFHLHNMDSLETLVHSLLILSILTMAGGLLCEMAFRSNPLAALTKCYFAMVQGTWFWQAGFILYNPIAGSVPWTADDNSLLLVNLMFTWHHGIVLILMILIGLTVYCFHGKKEIKHQLSHDKEHKNILFSSLKSSDEREE